MGMKIMVPSKTNLALSAPDSISAVPATEDGPRHDAWLEAHGNTLSKIATRFGYSDQTNFIRAFRDVIGMPPAEFRLRGTISMVQLYSRRPTR